LKQIFFSDEKTEQNENYTQEAIEKVQEAHQENIRFPGFLR
jgi:hypothetical protein